MKHGVIIDPRVVAYVDAWKDLNIVTDKGIFTNIAEGANENILSYYRRLTYIRRLLDAVHLLCSHLLVLR